MKNLLNLKNAKTLSKSEQQSINGGGKGRPYCCDPNLYCCTTSHLAQHNPSCGGTYRPGCLYHYATGCCI